MEMIFLLPLWLCTCFFLSFSNFLARVFNNVLNKTSKSRQLCFVPNFGVEAFGLAWLNILNCVFFIKSLYYIEVASVLNFLKCFTVTFDTTMLFSTFANAACCIDWLS